MTASYPDSTLIEYYNGASWVNISAYVVGDISGKNGLGGNSPTARVATLGMLNLTLNNKAKLFSPMGGDAMRGLNTMTGFNKDAKIRVSWLILGTQFVIWTGFISKIKSDDKNWGNEQVHLTAVDWMDVPTQFPMKNAVIETNRTIDQAITTVLGRLPKQPESVLADTGDFIFPSIFDNVRNKTMGISELNKLALSELGYIYIRGDGSLRVEKFTWRNGINPVDVIPDHPGDYQFFEAENGDTIITEDGYPIAFDTRHAFDMQNSMEDFEIDEDDDSVINQIFLRAYPTIVDTSLVNVYKSGTAFYVPGKGTVVFSAHYTDPNGYAQISATNQQTPVVTTDYLSNSLADGTGTNMSSDLQVTATYYGDTVDYSVYNNNASGCYVTKLNARGYGIYHGNTVEKTIEDATSQQSYGLQSLTIDQKYQKNISGGIAYAQSLLEEFKMPKSRIKSATFLANLSKGAVMVALFLQVGGKIQLYEDRSGIYNDYYITDRSFTINQGNIMTMTYGLKQADSYLSGGLNPVTLDFNARVSGGGHGINYGYLPQISGLPKRSISFWIYMRSSVYGFVFNVNSSGTEGFQLALGGTNQAQWYIKMGPTSLGAWLTPNNSLAIGTLYHIVATHDRSADLNAAPHIYINGVDQTLTVASTPVSSILTTEKNLPLFLTFEDGFVRDVRIYNTILSPTDVTTLYNSGTPDESLVTDGIVFQAPAVDADKGDATSLQDVPLTSSDRVIDNAFRMAGDPGAAVDIVYGGGYKWGLQDKSRNAYKVKWSPELGLFVSVGTGYGAGPDSSPDGITWTNRSGTTGWGLIYSPDLHMFISLSEYISLSTNGTSWSLQTNPAPGEIWVDGCWSHELGLFVAVRNNGAYRVMTSTNGINWFLRNAAENNQWWGVCWSKELGIFVAVGKSGTHRVMTSADGINWTPRTIDAFDWYSVVWSADLGMFVAVGAGCTAYSYDGVTWVANTTVANYFHDVAYSSHLKMFMATSGNDGGTIPTVITSIDGINWSTRIVPTVSPTTSFDGVCFSESLKKFVLVGSNGTSTKRAMTYGI